MSDVTQGAATVLLDGTATARVMFRKHALFTPDARTLYVHGQWGLVA